MPIIGRQQCQCLCLSYQHIQLPWSCWWWLLLGGHSKVQSLLLFRTVVYLPRIYLILALETLTANYFSSLQNQFLGDLSSTNFHMKYNCVLSILSRKLTNLDTCYIEISWKSGIIDVVIWNYLIIFPIFIPLKFVIFWIYNLNNKWYMNTS